MYSSDENGSRKRTQQKWNKKNKAKMGNPPKIQQNKAQKKTTSKEMFQNCEQKKFKIVPATTRKKVIIDWYLLKYLYWFHGRIQGEVFKSTPSQVLVFLKQYLWYIYSPHKRCLGKIKVLLGPAWFWIFHYLVVRKKYRHKMVFCSVVLYKCWCWK